MNRDKKIHFFLILKLFFSLNIIFSKTKKKPAVHDSDTPNREVNTPNREVIKIIKNKKKDFYTDIKYAESTKKKQSGENNNTNKSNKTSDKDNDNSNDDDDTPIDNNVFILVAEALGLTGGGGILATILLKRMSKENKDVRKMLLTTQKKGNITAEEARALLAYAEESPDYTEENNNHGLFKNKPQIKDPNIINQQEKINLEDNKADNRVKEYKVKEYK